MRSTGWSPGTFRSWLRGTNRLFLTASSRHYVSSMFDRELSALRAYMWRTVSPRKWLFWTLLRAGVYGVVWRTAQRSQRTCRVLCLAKPRAHHRGRERQCCSFWRPPPERLNWHFAARAARREKGVSFQGFDQAAVLLTNIMEIHALGVARFRSSMVPSYFKLLSSGTVAPQNWPSKACPKLMEGGTTEEALTCALAASAACAAPAIEAGENSDDAESSSVPLDPPLHASVTP